MAHGSFLHHGGHIRAKTDGASRSETDKERDGGCGRQLIRPRQRNKMPDVVEGMRRKRRRYQSRHQLLFLDQSLRRHSQQRHLQNVNAQTIPLQM
ncbi:hypothetical protein DPMN_056400, partial [Dreissena polymorpha]